MSKFGLPYLLQNTWTARSVVLSSYFSGIGGLEVALAYLNAAFKALASWICFLSFFTLLFFGKRIVFSFGKNMCLNHPAPVFTIYFHIFLASACLQHRV